MIDKICSHCGTTVLVGLQYCPGCLRALEPQDKTQPEATKPKDTAAIRPIAPAAAPRETFREGLQNRWEAVGSFFSVDEARKPTTNEDQQFEYNMPSAFATMSMSEGYTRVVCPRCLRAQKGSLDLMPSAMIVCEHCLNQFPGSFAAEFRKGADLECFRCGITTFCVNGLKLTNCPNCKVHTKKVRDPERTKAIVFGTAVAFVLLVMFAHAVVTRTTAQFLVWLSVGSVFSFFGFITMVALGF